MNDMKKECQKTFYETLYTLKTPGQSVVIDRTTDKIYLKKVLTDYNEYVYQYLHDHRNLHVPYVQFYYKEGDNLIVIEEYVSGNTLEELFERQNLSEEDRRKVLGGVLDAMEFLHHADPPIIHRDIKLSNIMITGDGVVKLIDYDAAKISRPGETRDTELIGTVGSAAPEQYGFAPSDARTDIYAFGVLLKTLFPSDEEYLQIVKKCTRMDPEDRYQDVDQLRAAIRTAETGAINASAEKSPEKISAGDFSQAGSAGQEQNRQDRSSEKGNEQKNNQAQISEKKRRRTLLSACICACVIVALILAVPRMTGQHDSGSAAKTTASSENTVADTQTADAQENGTDGESGKTASGSSTEGNSSSDAAAESEADNQASEETDTEKDTKSSSALKVTEKGYSVSSDGTDWFISAGVVYKNTSKSVAFEYPVFTVTAYDKKGNVIGTEEQTQNTVEPGETQAAYILCDCKEKPDHVRFSSHDGNRVDADEKIVKASDLKISGQTKQNDEYGTKFSGEIKNNGKQDLDSAAVVLILRKNGKIVYAENTFTDNLNEGATKAYTFDIYDPPEFDAYSVYAYSWDF